MKSSVVLTTSCVGLVLLSCCMQARIEESRALATPLAKGEREVILAPPQIEASGAEGLGAPDFGHTADVDAVEQEVLPEGNRLSFRGGHAASRLLKALRTRGA